MKMERYTYSHSSQIVRVYRALRGNGKLTASEIAEKCFVSRRSISRIVAALHDVGLCHVCEWRQSQFNRSSNMPVYTFGPGENVPLVAKERTHKVDIYNSQRGIDVVEWLEKHGPCLVRDIHVVSGSYRLEIVRRLLAENFVHIVRWEQINSNILPVYAAGKGKNVARPKKLTAAQASAKRRKRLIEEFGKEAAKSIIRSRKESGAEKIVFGGKTVYQRGGSRYEKRERT